MTLLKFLLDVCAITLFGDFFLMFLLVLTTILYRIAHNMNFQEQIKHLIYLTVILLALSLVFFSFTLTILGYTLTI